MTLTSDFPNSSTYTSPAQLHVGVSASSASRGEGLSIYPQEAWSEVMFTYSKTNKTVASASKKSSVNVALMRKRDNVSKLKHLIHLKALLKFAVWGVIWKVCSRETLFKEMMHIYNF